MRTRLGELPVHGDVMTFEEIGKALGITRGGAWMLYRSAINKLRKRKGALENLKQLVNMKVRREA